MSPETNTRVVLADSHYLTLEALQSLIGRETNYKVSEVANSLEELRLSLDRTEIGLLIIDPIALQISNSVVTQLKRQSPKISWLILTDLLTKVEFDEFFQSGISNIIYKNTGKDELLSATEAALLGKKYFSEEVLDLALGTIEKKIPFEQNATLTTSEIEIVRLIANGLTTKEIASRKNISHHTVNTHRKNIFRKMEVSNSSELILTAIKAGWIDNIEYFI